MDMCIIAMLNIYAKTNKLQNNIEMWEKIYEKK